MLADYPEDGLKNSADPDPEVDLTLSVYTTEDPEGGTVTLSLSGADEPAFKLTGTTAGIRTLELRELPDFEMPGDSNDDNVYEVTVVASDEVNTTDA